MSREYPENRRKFTEDEDALLRMYSDMGIPCVDIADRLARPVGSIYTRRRLLGIGKKRGPYGPRDAETPTIDIEVTELMTMRKYVVLFYGACLFAAGLLAFLGDV